MRRPPRTLWIASFRDLARLTALTTGVLVFVVAIGATFQPLSHGKLDASDVVTYVALACVPMLAYVLPFAAGFASTLTYHRIASDNETVAAHAGGISHRALLAPALAMGLLLGGVLLVFNEEVIPRFLERMQRMITVDISRILMQDIERGRAATVGKSIIYADRAERVEPEPGSGVMQQIEFRRFAVLQVDDKGSPVQELSASRATMFLMPATDTPASGESAQSVAVLRLEEALGTDAQGIFGVRQDTTLIFRVPDAFRDNAKFLTGSRLRALRARPEGLNWVDAKRRQLVASLARDELLLRIRRTLERKEPLKFIDPSGGQVTIRSSGIDQVGDALRLLPAPDQSSLDVLYPRPGPDGPISMRALAREATLVLPQAKESVGPPTVTIELRAVRTDENTPRPDFSGLIERSLLVLADLRLSTQTPLMEGPDSAIALVDAPVADGVSQTTIELRGELANAISRARKDVLAKSHERAAVSASCFIMVLTGAVTAMRFSRSQPLTIYLWTFLPAISCLATISGGQQLTRQIAEPGLLLLWSGVAALFTYLLLVYRSVSKH